jgi:protein-L-isoaspartate(D-aspartate) O-methyltransferase
MTDYAARRTMMVDTQVRPSDVTKFNIIDAMLRVRREVFTPDDKREIAYVSENIPLGGGRVMLEPRTLAKMLDALDIQPDEMVLDLGCGLGYSAALLARLADAVVAGEEIEELAREAETLLSSENVDNAAVIHAPLTEGAARHGPYDVIILQGGVERIPPAILDQIREGGRIAAIFMDKGLGACRLGYKVDGAVSWRFEFNASAPVLNGFMQEQAFML